MRESEKIALSVTKVGFFLLMCVHRRRYLKICKSVAAIQNAGRMYLAKCELRRRRVQMLDVERVKKIKVYLRNFKDKARLD